MVSIVGHTTLQSELPPILPSAVKMRLLRELFLRTRESSAVGLLAVALIVWAHLGRQPAWHLWLWTAIMLTIQCYRWLLAHTYVTQSDLQQRRYRRWYWLEWAGEVALAIGWASSLGMLGNGEIDALFYLRLIFVVAITAFLLSATGIEIRIYGSFIIVLSTVSVAILYRLYPDFLTQLTVTPVGFAIYACALLVRSHGEKQRAEDWIRARLTEKLLLDDLRRIIEQERETQEILRQKSIDLENSNRRLRELAIHDGLTQVFRRGYIETELQRLVKAQQRHPGHLCVLLLDLDHFKQVNDLRGHAAGDEVLRKMAARTQALLRGSDLLGRWGGEEFIILLPDTPLAQAAEAAQRIRQAVAQLEFLSDDAHFHITVSMGVAELAQGESAESLLRRADQALYEAKDAGRNRAITAKPLQASGL